MRNITKKRDHPTNRAISFSKVTYFFGRYTLEERGNYLTPDLQQILHRLVDLRVLERIKVYLRCGKIRVPKRFRNDRNVNPRSL